MVHPSIGFPLATGGIDRISRPPSGGESETIMFLPRTVGLLQREDWLGGILWVPATMIDVSDHLCAYFSHSFRRSTKSQ